MDKFKWCFEKENGLRMVEPDKDLADAYREKSLNALKSMNEVTDGDWKVSAAYYAMYFSLYSVVVRFGFKSEIHDCTIALMAMLKYYDEEDVKLLEKAKESRIRRQYYVNEMNSDEDIINSAALFCEKSAGILLRVNQEEILVLRRTLRTSLGLLG